MSKSQKQSLNNYLNEPINIYALDVNGFAKKETSTIYRDLPAMAASYVKYMGYTHVLLLNLNHKTMNDNLGNLAKAFTDAFHLNGIKVIFHLTPKDVTDKKLYVR